MIIHLILKLKKKIEERLNPEFEGRFKVYIAPNITNIYVTEEEGGIK